MFRVQYNFPVAVRLLAGLNDAHETLLLDLPRDLALALALAVSGCERSSDELTAAESRFVERFIALEHARAVALADPDRGDALLDSLALAWGDSAEAVAMRWFPTEPQRAERLHSLLHDRLQAESDSLARAPFNR